MIQDMTQGDHLKVTSKNEIEERIKYITKRLESWDYTLPCAIRIESFVASTSQSGLFHVWCRKIAEKWVTPKPRAKDEALIKMLLKNKFLGTYDYTLKNTTVAGQVRSTKSLSTGEWCFFLDQVHDFVTNCGVNLEIPINSDYSKLKRKQVS